MAVLTISQKETIAAIERQFIAVNETNNYSPFSVVDVNKLNAEVRRQKIGSSELNIHEKAMQAVRYELRDKLIERLNEDFKAGDIKLTAQEYGYDVKIILTKNIGSYSVENMIQIHINNLQVQTEFGRKTVGFEYSNESDGKELRFKCKTPEELFAWEVMEKRMVRLVEMSTR